MKRARILRRGAALLLALTLLAGLCGCGNVSEVTVTPWESERFSDAEVKGAIAAAERYFRKNFDGCTLTEITYAGDERSEAEAEYAVRAGVDEVLVLTSSFTVAEHGASPALNPGGKYEGYSWILGRSGHGPWRHLDHGYG